ncbi:Aste57867_23263 [Aphanomyces stellatus]|uniref:Aste57867_23263 protein n=1 Tax=Aphanomyces stellatus TaxID=120398 RepID=A0A485LNX5_9STRA|nr:hypothetical protein As57867_023192 [Aphanomyces stellatus]VFT99908.1 Aste57867_23263 [Aphanomyces stellatus]
MRAWVALLLSIWAALPSRVEVEVGEHGDLIRELGVSPEAKTSPWASKRQLDSGGSESGSVPLTCDLSVYADYLANDGKAMFVLSSTCEASIQYLKQRLAGRFGPVLQSDMEIVMCSDACVQSDVMHQGAMDRSHCLCSQLSTDSFISNDFCRQNSARLLCSILGVCGTWECKMEDFMCPRYDWDRMYPCASMRAKVSILAVLVAAWLLVVHH